ncbi:MAG: HAMP domain-containing protein [Candidatus Omnitrophica bacterium]|nr:HAMP domain-containing protein [Candidatus Omnitrophota bacterium]MCA9435608.1 HAMP domain-containing protein [Candidatus Omnitrophota bacterium]MCA9444215.1 HAMP domain-containing protein [Candidatus Omnitrophota bacterium]MCB9769326.1 HAMP domain-containing protein [Candidatus Omnitrophota bacterium]
MTKFRDWRLRQKFMAITALAAGLPLLFYAAIPLKSSFESLKSLQDDFLLSKMTAAESMVRQRRQMLEDTANLIAKHPDLQQFIQENSETLFNPVKSTDRTGAKKGERFQGIDLAYLYFSDGTVQFISAPPSYVNPQSFGKPIEEWLESESVRSSVTSGFSGVEGRKYLMAISKVRGRSEKEDSKTSYLVLGMDLDGEERVAQLFGTSVGDAMLTVDPKAETSDESIDPVTFIENDIEVGVRKPQKNLGKENQFLLTLYHPRGRYDEIESNQIWFFVLFLLGAYLAAVIGTAGSAAVVLKPLAKLIETMRSVSGPSTYSHRAPEDRKDEIGQLAINFNRLMRRLQVAQRELQIAQKHAIEAEKLETIHAMVITLAHEINNPLTALLGEAEMLLMDGRLIPADRTSVEVIRNMSVRIQKVITKLQDAQAVEMTAYTDWQQMIKVDLEEVAPAPVVASPQLVSDEAKSWNEGKTWDDA